MENMQMDVVNETVEFKDIEIDENSVKPSQPASTPVQDVPAADEDTDLGVVPVPVVANRESMIRLLEIHQDDTRFIMAIIRASTIDFTPLQRRIIEKIEREYALWYDPNNTQMVNYFDTYVIELRDDFYYQEAQDEDFFEEQQRQYSCVYRALTRYPFSYSDRQINLLESYKAQIDWTTGDPTQMADIGLMEDLQGLLSLMEERDHVHCSKFYVDCTVEYYVQQMVDELFYPAREEELRRVPDSNPDGALVNVATYVKNELTSIFHGVHYDTHCGLFHLGLSQIYTRMVNMLRFSGLLFTEHQRNLLRLVLQDIDDVVRNPSTSKYEDLHLGFYGIIDALRREYQELETKEEEGYKVIDEEGIAAKSVQKIMKDFYELQIAAEEHHKNFDDYASCIPKITKLMFRHFVRIIPPDQRIPVTVMLANMLQLYPRSGLTLHKKTTIRRFLALHFTIGYVFCF